MTDSSDDAAAVSVAATGRTATILVCPLSQVEQLAQHYGARRVLTLLGDPQMAVTPDGVTDHLVVHVHDIVTAGDNQILADVDHVQQVIDFAVAWDGRQPMLIHCLAGISRSTASAFIAACVLQPDRGEAAIADELRAASVTATPNRHFVALADQILGRGGRMAAAIDRIGRGVPAAEGTPFALTVMLAAADDGARAGCEDGDD